MLYLNTAKIKAGISWVLFLDWIQIVGLAVLFLKFFLELVCIHREPFHLSIFLVCELCVCSGAQGSS